MNKPIWRLAAATAAMIAMAPIAARADETSTTTSTTTSVTTTSLASIPTITPTPLGADGQPINYSLLVNPAFDYTELKQAHAEGFSNSEIASIAKISQQAGVPFRDVAQMALNGNSFGMIADRYNIRTFDYIDEDGSCQAKIAAYKAAYENTGANDVRNLVAASQQELVTTSTGGTVLANNNIAELVNSSPDLTMFSRALRSARTLKVLRGPGPLTVFAPTDAAFAKLSTDQVNALMSDRNALAKIVNYHIIPSRIDAAAAMSMSSPTSPATLEGDSLSVTSSGGNVFVNGASVVKPNLYATNGIIHEIDTVLLPPGTSLTTTTTTTTNNNTNLAPSTIIAPNSSTSVSPNGTTTTMTPNGTTTVEPNGATTVAPSGNGTTVTPNPNGTTTVTPNP